MGFKGSSHSGGTPPPLPGIGKKYEGKQLRETPKAKQAFLDWVALGPGRSLLKLYEIYKDQADAPTRNTHTLYQWSSKYRWADRLEVDMESRVEVLATKQVEQALAISGDGLAKKEERVAALNRLADALMDELGLHEGQEPKLTRTERMLTKDGTTLERDVFMKHEVEQFRGVLSDLAAESGGRSKKVNLDLSGQVNAEVTVKDQEPEERAAAILRELDKNGALRVLALAHGMLPAPQSEVIEAEAVEVPERDAAPA